MKILSNNASFKPINGTIRLSFNAINHLHPIILVTPSGGTRSHVPLRTKHHIPKNSLTLVWIFNGLRKSGRFSWRIGGLNGMKCEFLRGFLVLFRDRVIIGCFGGYCGIGDSDNRDGVGSKRLM